MQLIETLINGYPNLNAAANALGVHREQLKRLVDKGALYNEQTGVVFIPSPTKLNIN